VVALLGPGTPYITPDVLRRAPTGIDWSSIPNNRSSPAEQQAEQANMCLRATSIIDGWANQVLRATLDTELFSGPNWRVTIQNSTGVIRLLCARWPILQVVSCQVALAQQFPRQWQTIDPSQMDIEKPPIGLYGASQAADSADGGQSILLAPGTISWWNGRLGYRLKIQYVNGWPHTSLTQAVNQGATTLHTDDCTGWAPSAFDPVGSVLGATGMIYDGLQQEVVQCSAASAQSGPGTLTLLSPLSWPHQNGILVTTMPQSIINATIDTCAAMALDRGATATVVQSISGGSAGDGGPVTSEQLRKWAREAVQTYARVI
jgi:hypothetical protein